MGSGGTNCDGCRRRNSECICLPDRIRGEFPMCPWCGEKIDPDKESTTITCVCGKLFKFQKKVLFEAWGLR